MKPLYTPSQVQKADQFTIQKIGLPELVLMEHAALAVVSHLRERFGRLLQKSQGVIYVGSGNNGGDGLAVARLLSHEGCRNIQVVMVGDHNHLGESSQVQYRVAERLEVPIVSDLNLSHIGRCDWVVDALLGTGVDRDVEGKYRSVVEQINQHAGKKWVVSVDVPSGLNSETGQPMGIAVRASETVSLGFLKSGLVTGKAAEYTGQLHVHSIQIPRNIPDLEPTALLYEESDAISGLPSRDIAGHKGSYGHVFIHAGVAETSGASGLSALAALRAGCGKVTVVDGDPAKLPNEIMTHSWDPSLENQITAFGVGPGFGTGSAQWKRFLEILALDKPLVIDADGLTLMSQHPEETQERLKQRKQPTILTPHPGEAARLLETDTGAVESDRYRSCRDLVERWGTHVVLKGKGSLIGSPNRPVIVVSEGDSGLSKGGTGDVLTGILTSLLAQKISPAQALPLGVYLHGKASEFYSRFRGDGRCTLPSEIIEALPSVTAELVCGKKL